MSELWRALCKVDDIEYVRKHVTIKNVNDIDPIINRGILHMTSMLGHIKCLEYALQLGADVELRTSVSETPLFSACRYNYIGCIRLLLKFGADPNVKNETCYTPCDLVINYHAVKLSIDNGFDINNLKKPLRWDTNRMKKFIETRNVCRRTSIIMIGLKGRINTKNNKDAFRHIGKHIWSMRML
jgi:hypothetical protein